MTTTSTASAAPTSTGAPVQGGIIEGLNPLTYSPSNPINLFIIQACIIILFCRLLHYPFSWLGQPRVIAEVLGGIILGPSVMMRIPGFQENIFPTASMPVLSNVANLGLILFLFLVGLEVDTRLFRSNWKVALNVGLAGMALPFGLGFAIAWGLFNEFRQESSLKEISFATYGLFIGTAMAITAFPVLCRILSELQLLTTPVGLTVLAAGIGNDVTGWILLALSVALVNNSTGLSALWVLLAAVAWILFLVFAVRPSFRWTLRRSGAFQNDPSPAMITLALIIVLVSAWFTASIGVHPIFGAFLAGIICPHDGGFNIKLTRKIEDLVSVFFVPLYFALSGLSTNLGLLNNGITWAYVVGIIAVAFFGKVVGGTLAARACNLLWGESLAIGVLMSCKGLVELIVLNLGFQAKILSQRTFTMFVVMALVTTVATTPLTKWIYPVSYRIKVAKWKMGEIEWDGTPIVTESQLAEEKAHDALNKGQISRLLVQLRLDILPSLFGLVNILGDAITPPEEQRPKQDKSSDSSVEVSAVTPNTELGKPSRAPLIVHGVRLVELNDRTSSVMQSAEMDEYAEQDLVCSTFQTFSSLHGVAATGKIRAVPTSYFADAMVDQSREGKADLMLLPWSSHGNLREDTSLFIPAESVSRTERFHNKQHVDFIRDALQKAACNVGVFISLTAENHSRSKRPILARTRTGLSVQSAHDSSPSPIWSSGATQRIFFPFIGGADDQAALSLVMQLARSSRVSVTIAHCIFADDEDAGVENLAGDSVATASATADIKGIIKEPSASDLTMLNTARESVGRNELRGRVHFIEINANTVTEVPSRAVDSAKVIVKKSYAGIDDLVIVGRQHNCLRHIHPSDDSLRREFQRTVGVMADRMCHADIEAGVLVIQAGPVDREI